MTTWTEQRGREAVRTASAGRCQLQVPWTCEGRAAGVHHRSKRSAGGSWHPANLVDACGSGTTGCHGYVEAHPLEAGRFGWWLLREQDALEVPAWLWTPQGRGWWLWRDDATTELMDLAAPSWPPAL